MSKKSQNLATWQVLTRSHRRMQSHLETALKVEGLPGLDVLDALDVLAEATGALTAKAMESLLAVPQYSVSRLLDRMEKEALIQRHTDSGDKRIRHVELTETGRETHAAMVRTRDAALNAFLSARAKPGQLERMADLLALLDQDAPDPTSG